MVRIIFSLFILFSLPVLLVALALKSWIVLMIGMVTGTSGAVFVILNAWTVVLDELKPSVMPPSIRARLERLFSEFASVKMKGEFLLYRSAEPEVKVWARHRDSVVVFMSLAFIETATDEGIIQIFRDLTESRLKAIRNENCLFSIRLIFKRWKGSMDRFRYWFISFLLFPIEQMLKIARI